MKENYLWPELEKRQRELERLRKENALLRDALKSALSFIDLIMAHAEEMPTTPLTNAATIGQEIEQALAKVE